jgi:hypothetical protein
VYEGIAVPYVAASGGGPAAVGLLLAADPVGSVGLFGVAGLVRAAALSIAWRRALAGE